MATCAVSPVRLSLMRSPRKVTTSVCMPGYAQYSAQIFLGGALVDRGIRLELHMELASMRAPGILAEFRAADLLLDGLYVGQLQHFGADALADVQHLVQRGARDRSCDTCMTKCPSRKSGMKVPPRNGSTATPPDQGNEQRRSTIRVRPTPWTARALPALQARQPARFGRASCRRSNNAHRAGVVVMATSSEATTASMKARARGPTNVPARWT